MRMGDRVRALAGAELYLQEEGADKDRPDITGLLGTIVLTYDELDADMVVDIGVEFDLHVNGHDCGHAIPGDKGPVWVRHKDGHCWWLRERDLELVPAHDPVALAEWTTYDLSEE